MKWKPSVNRPLSPPPTFMKLPGESSNLHIFFRVSLPLTWLSSCWSRSQLLECLRDTRTEKKIRRKVLKEFEDEFSRQTGRWVHRNTRHPKSSPQFTWQGLLWLLTESAKKKTVVPWRMNTKSTNSWKQNSVYWRSCSANRTSPKPREETPTCSRLIPHVPNEPWMDMTRTHVQQEFKSLKIVQVFTCVWEVSNKRSPGV